MNGTYPVITLEVQGMRHTISTALMAHQVQMDADVQAAIDAYCTPDNIAKVIRSATTGSLDQAIREEVDKFFRYGKGRQAVADAVRQSLLGAAADPLGEI